MPFDDAGSGSAPGLPGEALDHSGLGSAPGLPDEAFEHDGLLTKRPMRAMALAQLRPVPGALLWDLGCGAGSIAVEWARAGGIDPSARAIGVERDPVRAARARGNASRLTAPGQVEIRCGDIAEQLSGLPRPDAVFLGGGVTDDVVEACLAALPAGGRLVAHAVTVETEAVLVAAYRRYGGELTRVAVENLGSLGGMLGWRPTRAVVQFGHVRHALPPRS